mmetsp:Transcript_51922/g.63574  ORF Transcript_51922/g.63574 Transcript_51922/m.63574 type:complete len:380 (+) Transcript_51922:70-1209(+)
MSNLSNNNKKLILDSIKYWNNDYDLFEHIRKLFECNQTKSLEMELCVERLIELAPNNWTYHLFCVQIFKEWKDYNKAYYHINRGVKILKKQVKSGKLYNRWLSTFYWFKAHMLFNEKKFDQICECMTISLRHEHKDMDLSYNWRASAFCELKKYDNAISDYTKAIKCSTSPSSYFNSRGTCYHETKQYELALKDYNQALKLDKQCVSGYNNRASLFVELGDFFKALKDCEDGLRIYPRHGNLYKHKGMALFGIQKYGESIDCLQTAIKLVPNYRPARISLKIIWNFYFNGITKCLYTNKLYILNNENIDLNLIKLLCDFIVGNNYYVTNDMVDATYSDWKKELNEYQKQQNNNNSLKSSKSGVNNNPDTDDDQKMHIYN